MTKSKNIKPFTISDARLFAPATAICLSDDMLILDDFTNVNLTCEALQLGFLAFAFCTRGQASFGLNAQIVKIEAGDLFIGIGEQVFNKREVSKDFQAVTILVSRKYMNDSLAGLHQLWQYLQFLYRNPVIHLAEDEGRWTESSFNYIKMRLNRTQHSYMDKTITALIRLFYFDVCDLLSRHATTLPREKTGNCSMIFNRFIQLLDSNYKKERNVSWYSEQLCLTPKYLSEAVKAASGKTAGQWISDFVIMETKQLLCNTSLSVKEISQRMNFTNQSFLGKYFKNATGVSPSDYRRQ